MAAEDNEMQLFAKKIARYCKNIDKSFFFSPHRVIMERGGLRGMHLPSLSIPRPMSSAKPIIKSRTIEAVKEPGVFHHAALETHQCSQNQEIHLHNHKKIFEEKRFVTKSMGRAVVDWKLAKPILAKQNIRSYVNELNALRDKARTKRSITGIDIKHKEGSETSIEMQEQCELARQKKDERAYRFNNKGLI